MLKDKKVQEMSWLKAKGIILDPYSTLTMTYTPDGFNELLKDIQKNGQLVPIVLRNGKVLDGRDRLQVCQELGISIQSTEKGNISDEEALDLVISNSINKATGTDASKVEAYLLCKAKGMLQKDMPRVFSRLNTDYIKKMAYIERENPKYLEALLKQNSVRLYNKQFDKIEDYGTINGIWRTLKGNKRLEEELIEVPPESVVDKQYDTYIEDVMVSCAAEQKFWEVYELGKAQGVALHPDSPLGKELVTLINGVYGRNDEKC